MLSKTKTMIPNASARPTFPPPVRRMSLPLTHSGLAMLPRDPRGLLDPHVARICEEVVSMASATRHHAEQHRNRLAAVLTPRCNQILFNLSIHFYQYKLLQIQAV